MSYISEIIITIDSEKIKVLYDNTDDLLMSITLHMDSPNQKKIVNQEIKTINYILKKFNFLNLEV